MKLNFSIAFRLFSIALFIYIPIANAQLKEEAIVKEQALNIANAIPEAGELSIKLVQLQLQIAKLFDIASFKQDITALQDELAKPITDIQALKTSDAYEYAKFKEVRRKLENVKKQFAGANKPLIKGITELTQLADNWRVEQQRWLEWHDQLPDEYSRKKLGSTFSSAQEIISQAQHLLNTQLDLLLEEQRQSSLLDLQIKKLSLDLDLLMGQHQLLVLHETSPPMLSSQYLAQFNTELWTASKIGLYEAVWPDKWMLTRDSWILMLQAALTICIGLVIKNKHAILKSSERWRFIGLRPLSASIFFALVLSLLVYEYAAEFSWGFMTAFIGGASFIRLTNVLLTTAWKKQFVLAVIVALLIWRLMHFFNLPLPAFRLGIALMAIFGAGLCFLWFWQSMRKPEAAIYKWLLGLLGGYLGLVFFLEIWGKEVLAEFLFSGLVRATAAGLAFLMFAHVLRGVLDWIFWGSPLRRINLLQHEAEQIIRRMNFFFNLIIWGLAYIPSLLMIFRVYDNLPAATSGLLALGFSVGDQRFTIRLLIIAAVIIYGCYLLSWIIQKLMLNGILMSRTIERGVRISISRLINYTLVFLGYMAVLLLFGFEFSNLAIMLSALGVGIGFGLQGIVNNFISGLILLFERPVRVGDIIEINGIWAEIKKIGLRATMVETYDQSDIIVPNADLVSSQVTNWTLSNRQVRLIISVGVAYGSNVPLVIETLQAAAEGHPRVSKIRKPVVLFLNFAESSLDFELRVWVFADDRMEIKSELLQDINQRFNDANIEIAFPQRDLHIRSIDEQLKFQQSS